MTSQIVSHTPLRTGYVSSGMTAWQEVSAIAGETLTHSTPRVGGFRNDRINPFYKEGFRLASGEILVIQHERMSGDMKVAVFASLDAQRAYEAEGEKLVADPETGRRPALETSTNGVANLLAHVEVYEAPLAYDAPTQPELSEMPEVKPEYLEADYFASKEADAVLHEAPALDGIRKGDLVRVQTSNPRVPFVGRVEKLMWDGRLIVRQGTVTYRSTLDKATVLMKVNGVETAAQR